MSYGKTNDGKARQNSHTHDRTPTQTNEEDVVATVLKFILAQQYSLNRGLKIFGEKGKEATRKELRQIHIMDVTILLDTSSLSDKEKKRAIALLMFLTENWEGMIKVQQYADEYEQGVYMEKDESASPMVSIKAIFLKTTIEAKERREVAAVDPLGAFLHAINDKDVIMFMQGRLAELMVMVAPQAYLKFISFEKGQKVLHVKVHKVLYGMLKSALLFYQKMQSDLEEMGFEVNPYDPCVANKIVNGSQMTITWHIDDLKISHRNDWGIMKMIKSLEKRKSA